MFQQMTVKLEGVAPLVFHNGRLADPMDPFAKEIKRLVPKSKKSEEVAIAMGIVEWCGSLCHSDGEVLISDGVVAWDSGIHPVIPAAYIKGMIVGGSKRSKLGQKAKAGVIVEHDARLEYSGPKDMNVLMNTPAYRLRKTVRVRTDKVMRTRPIFRVWAAEIKFEVNPEAINPDDVLNAIMVAGREIGIGDWKPEHGRFEVTL